jgi:hypothetical protein
MERPYYPKASKTQTKARTKIRSIAKTSEAPTQTLSQNKRKSPRNKSVHVCRTLASLRNELLQSEQVLSAKVKSGYQYETRNAGRGNFLLLLAIKDISTEDISQRIRGRRDTKKLS